MVSHEACVAEPEGNCIAKAYLGLISRMTYPIQSINQSINQRQNNFQFVPRTEPSCHAIPRITYMRLPSWYEAPKRPFQPYAPPPVSTPLRPRHSNSFACLSPLAQNTTEPPPHPAQAINNPCPLLSTPIPPISFVRTRHAPRQQLQC